MYELVSPVNPIRILKYLGFLLIAQGFVIIVPGLVAVLYGQISTALLHLIIAAVLILLGYGIYRALPESELLLREAVVIAAVIFPLSAAISAIPLSLCARIPYINAFFEAVSGITTTGLTMMPNLSDPVVLFTRSWLQWIGGIGFVVLVLSILISPGTSAFRLFAVSLGSKRLRPTVVSAAKLLGQIYLVITLISISLLWLGGMHLFDAVCHAMSSVSTGGFSTQAGSIGAFPALSVFFAICFTMVMGAMDFGLYPHFLQAPAGFFRDPQVRTFGLLAAIGAALLICTLIPYLPADQAVFAAVFQAISALTTTGFSTLNIEMLPDASKAVLIVLMWIGGCYGSTAGGIKIIRFLIFLKLIQLVFARIFLPREVVAPLKVGNQIIEMDDMYNQTAFLLLYIGILIASTFVFILFGFGMMDSLFEVSSALGTVGLSIGITTPALPLFLKVLLCVDMLLGRLEIIPFLVLFIPRTWMKASFEKGDKVEKPEEAQG
jgi:trk system potassium uptake protein TrkH